MDRPGRLETPPGPGPWQTPRGTSASPPEVPAESYAWSSSRSPCEVSGSDAIRPRSTRRCERYPPWTARPRRARIGRGPAEDHLGLVFVRQPFQLVVVQPFRLCRNAIRYDLVAAAGKVERMPMRKMASVSQVHPQHSVAVVQRGQVNRHIGLGARMGLNVHVFRAKQLQGPITREVLDNVHVLAASVIPLA